MFSMPRKRSRAVAEIHLSPSLNDTTETERINSSWLSNEDINGYAVFKLPPGVEFSHSKIALKGVVTTRTDDNPPGSLQRRWRTEEFHFLGVALDSKPHVELRPDNGVVRIQFRFNLEDIRYQFSVLSDLPPSVSSKKENKQWTGLRKYELDNQYDISYSIIASVFSRPGLAASTTQTIHILPVSQAQPPLCPSDFPGESFLAAKTSRQYKVHLTKPSNPRIEVIGQEPEPLSLNAHENFSHGSTDVLLLVKALPQSLTTLDQRSLPTQCQLKAQLVTKTLVAPNRIEEKAIPTLEQAKYGEDSYLRVHKSDGQEFTVAIPRWDHYTPNLTEQFALSRFSFLFNLAGGKVPSPTFFTPLLLRRYAIDITLAFPGISGPGLKLSLPVQVVYEAIEIDYVKAK